MPRGCTPTKESGAAAKKKPTDACDKDKEKCPLEDKVKLVELVEAVTHKGKETTQPPAGRKQYVNLDDKVDPGMAHPEYGRVIRLKARVEWVAGERSRPLSGKQVYWHYKAHGGNRTGLQGSWRPGFGSPGTEEKTTTTDAKGWTPVIEFNLSKYGGDKFDVFASEDSSKNGDFKAGTYTVWRKLFYELDTMKKGVDGSYSANADTAGMKTKFESEFLEVEQVGSDSSPAHQRLMTDAEVGAWAEKIRTGGSSKPRYFHLVLLDTIAVDRHPKKVEVEMVTTAKITLPGSSYSLDPRDWFQSCKYEQGAKKGGLATGKLTLTESGSPSSKDDKYVIAIDFSDLGLDASKKVKVAVEVKNWRALSGLQIGLATIIGMRWRGSDANLGKSTLNTMMHEPGHAMGLASTTLPDGSAAPDTYFKAGHHCKRNSNNCVMYEANSRSTDFCDHCGDALRGRDLAKLPLSGTDKFS